MSRITTLPPTEESERLRFDRICVEFEPHEIAETNTKNFLLEKENERLRDSLSALTTACESAYRILEGVGATPRTLNDLKRAIDKAKGI